MCQQPQVEWDCLARLVRLVKAERGSVRRDERARPFRTAGSESIGPGQSGRRILPAAAAAALQPVASLSSGPRDRHSDQQTLNLRAGEW